MQSCEQFLFTGKQRVKSRDGKGLAKAPRTGEKENGPLVDNIDKILRFVDIKIAALSELLKILNADGEFKEFLPPVYAVAAKRFLSDLAHGSRPLCTEPIIQYEGKAQKELFRIVVKR